MNRAHSGKLGCAPARHRQFPNERRTLSRRTRDLTSDSRGGSEDLRMLIGSGFNRAMFPNSISVLK